MSRQRISKGKTIRPTFFVFCEGESEEAYVKYLKSKYRLPIEVDPKVAGLNVNSRYISNYKKGKSTHPKDKDFLIYDLDRDDILPRLQKIRNANILISVPCFELWYLLHCENQQASLNSADCLNKLSKHIKGYKKGALCEKVQSKINDKWKDAQKRAAKLPYLLNPSTNVYVFVEELEKVGK